MPAKKSNWISTFMGDCGHDSCQVPAHEVLAVQANIQANGAYKTFGLTGYLFQYLEMLECVYPSMLTGIVQLYKTRKPKINQRNETNYSSETVQIVRKLANDKCLNSSDEYLYHHILNITFWNRYNALKASPRSCCRNAV